MSDELLTKAQIAQQKEVLRSYIAEQYPKITEERQVEFILEFILTGQAAKSYQKVYKNPNYSSSAVLANRIFKKVKFSLSDMLDAMGHTKERLIETLETLRNNDPKEYVKYMLRLRGLDVQKQQVDVSGSIATTVFTANISDLELEEDGEEES